MPFPLPKTTKNEYKLAIKQAPHPYLQSSHLCLLVSLGVLQRLLQLLHVVIHLALVRLERGHLVKRSRLWISWDLQRLGDAQTSLRWKVKLDSVKLNLRVLE